MEKENKYRPKLEQLALNLYETRKEKRAAEKEDKDLGEEIKGMMAKAGIKQYNGKNIEVKLSLSVNQQVDVKKLLKHISLNELLEAGLLSISNKQLQEYLKEKKLDLKPADYLGGGKPYGSLDLTLKG